MYCSCARPASGTSLVAAFLFLGLSHQAMGGSPQGCAAGAGGPTPGTFVFPIDCTGVPPGILLADMVSRFSYATSMGTNSGTIESAIYNNGGTLDFYYQITNDASSATGLARFTVTNFTGW